ncbi:hypothetical protein TCDM_12906 [Trypanosoma cruzi Dm28c]|uniref:Uncharacterized protein n=1 Tax=Trypanosoma cruzi Dm28c TaxID=1416333 RepID=V5AU44_TRYCR|nr:hypothetical protein TCDM_12906 [Trypanosoma cruzi Dm28c]
MCNFVCGNANAPRRVSHVPWIKFHGANVVAKIRRCVARGRPHNAHGASTHHTSHTRQWTLIHHDAAKKFPAIPPSMGHGAQLNAVTRGAPHPQKKRLGLRTPSLPFSSWPRKKTTAATRNCQHALQKKHSNPLQCASCVYVVVCACRNTKQRKLKREQSM